LRPVNRPVDAPVSIPRTRRFEQVREVHGHRRVDGYAWLRDVDSPEVVEHLAAERAYYEAATAHLHPLVESLVSCMASRVPDVDRSPAYRRSRFSYYTRTPTESGYQQLWRGRDLAETDDQLLLDPATLLGESSYVEVGLSLVSPDERVLAYSVDTTGDEVYSLRFAELEDGGESRFGEVIERSYYGGAWSADSSTFFYTVHDELYRPHQVWRHRLGTAAADDVLVFADDDQQYELDVHATRSGDLIIIRAANRDTSEVWLVDAHRPDDAPRCVQPRRRGVEYDCEHVRTASGDQLLIVTNEGAQEFRMVRAPLGSPGREHWTEVLAAHPVERLYDVTAFADHVVTTLRRDTVLMARAYRLGDDGSLTDPVDLAPSHPHATLELADNEMFAATEVQVVEQSWIQPRSWFAVDLDTGARRPLSQQEVPSYDPGKYVSERRLVPGDGVGVPVTIVRHVDTPLDGSAPCLLYGYGAYEACFDPEFDVALTALLDRGVVWAHAAVRGGGEGGRRWWLDGRLSAKQNSFSDHLAVADFLADGLVDGDRVVTRGLSAGGMLQGGVFSQAPGRWAGVIAEVPAVDILTTMLDPTIPLTVNEYDEWGDPRDPEQYRWLLGYSPYDNLPPAGSRPDLLVTGALHDARVMVWEPAKWVAELRHTDPEWAPRCLFRVELGEGAHVGPSGRFAQLRYEAEIYSWALERFGMA
jgi:oligopeptidase B